MFKNALVSVSDKTGLIEFLAPLANKGLRIVSTGGTAQFLKSHNIPVTQVSEQTGYPEVMDGRVRTLHPRIHMPLLARSSNPDDMALLKKEGIEAFDLVVGNLYPFEKKLNENEPEEEMIESIDIGGPSFLRSAAKSFERITVVCDPNDYASILNQALSNGGVTLSEKRKLAAKVFAHVSGYDSVISNYLNGNELMSEWSLSGRRVQTLRYGENPHQSADWYSLRGANKGIHTSQILQGKELSYNNLLDIEAAVASLRDLKGPSAVVVKHNNPCGAASNEDSLQALKLALTADPVSVFGGIVALNFAIEQNHAESLSQLFLECIVSPKVTEAAKAIFAKKKNLRVLEWPDILTSGSKWEVRTLSGGFLVQQTDVLSEWSPTWQVFGETPRPSVKADMQFAWSMVKNLKSNAISLVSGLQTLGLGMGQVNRVEAVEHAISRMKLHHPNAKNVVAASDAFFPFPDSIERLAQSGVNWVIQPGGSVKDQEVIEVAQKLKVNLVMTGTRHFRH